MLIVKGPLEIPYSEQEIKEREREREMKLTPTPRFPVMEALVLRRREFLVPAGIRPEHEVFVHPRRHVLVLHGFVTSNCMFYGFYDTHYFLCDFFNDSAKEESISWKITNKAFQKSYF